jgi:hypothetical protein
MNRRRRQVIAIALVAAALCADRAVAAAPTERPQAQSVAGRFVSRLSVTFRRVLPGARVYQTRCDQTIVPQPVASRPNHDDVSAGLRTRLSPLLIHLPPPTARL